ncbi:MAG: glutamine--fructose-6-phosphate transaminase (isomerizing) [Candidatus Sericytochromatia bacterium]|nr:glutamine--fructose-6-phosphate transaminase (isomerizing) [Candidatus Sericytochromatia bacterium]
MCGIVGYIGDTQAADLLMEGLSRLEYRGYDSAGIAVLNGNGLDIRREVGKLRNLAKEVAVNAPKGLIGIGHTRWATHGRPTTTNAHPHTDTLGQLVVVHNGIFENYLEIKHELIKDGVIFLSDTDSEVLAHLVARSYTGDLRLAVQVALSRMHGSYAIAVLHQDHPDLLVAARNGCPLILGIGAEENFIASDIPAILNHTRQIIYLEDGDIAEVRQRSWSVFNLQGERQHRDQTTIEWSLVAAEKGGYDHFMLKEINEQPTTLAQTLGGRMGEEEGRVYVDEFGITDEQLRRIRQIVIVACGTSHYAGLVGEYYFEQLARIPTTVEYASEFRYRKPVVDGDTLIIGLSQSGETADTLAAIREANNLGGLTASILNVQGSAMSRETQGTLYMRVGPEIGVASTKAYTGTVASLLLVALHTAQVRGHVTADFVRETLGSLRQVPSWIEETLAEVGAIQDLAAMLHTFRNCLYLGRGVNYPTALEGALKLKELSYIHAEALPAGEMKHGPIALLDADFPVIAVATKSAVYDKTLSNLKEVAARDAVTIALGTRGDERLAEVVDRVIYVPETPEIISPLVNVVPLQLLAYYVATKKGCDVDQPRNLAKSVTVE